MKRTRKILYVAFTGFLTSLAMSACYWQSSKYLDSRRRWKIISNQLSQQNPKNISQLQQQQKQNLYAFKYIELQGKLSPEQIIISRARGMRTGYLVLRKINYKYNNQQNKQMIALDGWCPQNYQLKKNQQDLAKTKPFRGILRKKQNTDYLHKKMKESDLQKFKMNTWINLERYLEELNIKKDEINQNFYFQILKPISEEQTQNTSSSSSVNQQAQQYPYRYSVDNFELPYLTPQKHQGYATFWFCTSLVGWFAIIKVLRMK